MKLHTTVLLISLALAGCTAAENVRQSVERTGNTVGQKLEKVDAKVAGPLQRSRAKQVIDKTGATIDKAIDGALRRN